MLNDKLQLPHRLIHHSFILISCRFVTAQQCLGGFPGVWAGGCCVWEVFRGSTSGCCVSSGILFSTDPWISWRWEMFRCSTSRFLLPFFSQVPNYLIPDVLCALKMDHSPLLPYWLQHCVSLFRFVISEFSSWRGGNSSGNVSGVLPVPSCSPITSLRIYGAGHSY